MKNRCGLYSISILKDRGYVAFLGGYTMTLWDNFLYDEGKQNFPSKVYLCDPPCEPYKSMDDSCGPAAMAMLWDEEKTAFHERQYCHCCQLGCETRAKHLAGNAVFWPRSIIMTLFRCSLMSFFCPASACMSSFGCVWLTKDYCRKNNACCWYGWKSCELCMAIAKDTFLDLSFTFLSIARTPINLVAPECCSAYCCQHDCDRKMVEETNESLTDVKEKLFELGRGKPRNVSASYEELTHLGA